MRQIDGRFVEEQDGRNRQRVLVVGRERGVADLCLAGREQALEREAWLTPHLECRAAADGDGHAFDQPAADQHGSRDQHERDESCDDAALHASPPSTCSR